MFFIFYIFFILSDLFSEEEQYDFVSTVILENNEKYYYFLSHMNENLEEISNFSEKIYLLLSNSVLGSKLSIANKKNCPTFNDIINNNNNSNIAISSFYFNKKDKIDFGLNFSFIIEFKNKEILLKNFCPFKTKNFNEEQTKNLIENILNSIFTLKQEMNDKEINKIYLDNQIQLFEIPSYIEKYFNKKKIYKKKYKIFNDYNNFKIIFDKDKIKKIKLTHILNKNK
jgi:hypothetical protein